MRSLLASAIILTASIPAFARPSGNVPEPEMFALLAVGVAGLLLARRRK